MTIDFYTDIEGPCNYRVLRGTSKDLKTGLDVPTEILEQGPYYSEGGDRMKTAYEVIEEMEKTAEKLPRFVNKSIKGGITSDLANRRNMTVNMASTELANLAKQNGKKLVRNPVETEAERNVRGVVGGAAKGLAGFAAGTGATALVTTGGNLELAKKVFKDNPAAFAVLGTGAALSGAKTGYRNKDSKADARRNNRNYSNTKYLHDRGINNFPTGGQILTDKLKNGIALDGASRFKNAYEVIEEMEKTASENNEDKKMDRLAEQQKGAIAIGGGTLVANKALKSGMATGRETMYHNTDRANVKSIMRDGVKSSFSTDPNNLTNRVFGNQYKDDIAGKIYFAKKKSSAEGVGLSAKINGVSKGPRDTIKVNAPSWKMERGSNPELKNLDRLRQSGKIDPLTHWAYKRELGPKGTNVFQGDMSPEYIKGSKNYKRNSFKEIKEYAKAKPKDFAIGAGAVVGGTALVGYGANKFYKAHKAKKEDDKMKTAYEIIEEMEKTAFKMPNPNTFKNFGKTATNVMGNPGVQKGVKNVGKAAIGGATVGGALGAIGSSAKQEFNNGSINKEQASDAGTKGALAGAATGAIAAIPSLKRSFKTL